VLLSATLFISVAQTTRPSGGGAAGTQQKNAVSSAPVVVDERDLGLSDAAVADTKNDPSSLGSIIRTVLALVVVVAAVYGVVYLLKRVTRQTEVKDPHLKVLASAHLGSNRFVHVVALGQKAWLIGATDGGVDLIAEVEDAETRDTLFLEDSRRQSERVSSFPIDFKSLMRKLGSGEKAEIGAGAESIRKRRERLRGF